MPLTTTGGSLEEITAGRRGRPQRGTRRAALTRHLRPLQVPEVLHCHFQNVRLLQLGMPRALHRIRGKALSENPASGLGVWGPSPSPPGRCADILGPWRGLGPLASENAV